MWFSPWRGFSERSLARRGHQAAKSRRSQSRGSAKRPLGVESLEPRWVLSYSPAGDAFTINVVTAGDQTTTTGLQSTDQTPNSVAVDGDGDFVVTWQSYGQDGSGWGLYARRYSSAGGALTGEIPVANTTAGDQVGAVVATDAQGDFVIAWTSYDPQSTGADIYARRFTAAGVPVGNEFRVNTFTPGDQITPGIAMDNSGDFVITWNNLNRTIDMDNTILAQRFNANGVPLGGEIGVDTFAFKASYGVDVAMDALGNFVVAWSGGDPNDSGISNAYARRFHADGTALGPEFIANDSTVGGQSTTVVAMNAQGDFVIAWGGIGPEDDSGIFARKFNAAGAPQGGQFIVNTELTLDEVQPSVAIDSLGTITVTWGGYGPQPSSPPYARQFSPALAPLGDQFTVGVVGTALNSLGMNVAVAPDGDVIFAWAQGQADDSGLAVLARRYLSTVHQAPPTVGNVYVPEAPTAILAGQVVTTSSAQLTVTFSENLSTAGGAVGVQSVLNPANWSLTRNGIDVSAQLTSVAFSLNAATRRWEAVVSLSTPLSPADYVLTAKSTLRDIDGLGLDGDLDGLTGGNYSLGFSVAAPLSAAAENRANTFTTAGQRAGANPGRSVAVSSAGDYVVVWASDAQDGSGEGVFGQRYSATGAPLGGEFRVNVTTAGNQSSPSVACDAAGDFLVVWTSAGQDGSGAGVYGRRYSSAGVALTSEFRINTTTTNDQLSPAAAMDLWGHAVVVWTSVGQDGDAGGIYAQRFDDSGVPAGREFRISSATAGNQTGAQVAMDAAGDFLVAWISYGQDGDDGGIYARRYEAAGSPLGDEFLVNTSTAGQQRFPSVAVDYSGDAVVAWQIERTPSGSSVLFQRFSAAGTPLGVETPVDTLLGASQSAPSVTLSATGRITVGWTSDGQDGSGAGLFARQLQADGAPWGGVFALNSTTTGDQDSATLASDAGGNLVAAWTGDAATVGDTDVFIRRWTAGPDTSAPVATGLRTPGNDHLIHSDEVLTAPITQLVVGFSENLSVAGGTSGAHSVTNPAHWRLRRASSDVSGLIGSIAFAFDTASRRYQATLTLTGVLPDGGYLLELLPAVTDADGNAMDGNADGSGGDALLLGFNLGLATPSAEETRVNTTTAGNQATAQPASRAVGFDGTGNSVIVWASQGQDGGGWGVYGQRYSADGALLGGEFLVNTTTPGDQRYPSVAMGASGEFVITWTSDGQDGSLGGIFARRYNGQGAAQGDEFRVNTTTADNQFGSDVALDALGNFVVVWNSTAQDGSGTGVYARRYAATGTALSGELPVNTTSSGNQFSAVVAGDALGNFVVVWVSNGQDQGGDGVYGQQFSAAGTKLGTEFRVNVTTAGDQNLPAIAANAAGEFVVSWTSAGQDGSGAGVFARRYNRRAAPLGGEFLVNTTTTGNQTSSSVGIDTRGNAFIAWSSDDQDGSGTGIYAQAIDGAGATFGGQQAINLTTAGDQGTPKVAFSAAGGIQIVWTSAGQDGSGQGVYRRAYYPSAPPSALGIAPLATYENSGQSLAVDLWSAFSDLTTVSSQLSYSVFANSNPGLFSAVSLNAATGQLILSFVADQHGEALLTVRAVDPQGLFVDSSFMVTVFDTTDQSLFKVGSEFRVNTTTAGNQGEIDNHPESVAMAADGHFVVVWQAETAPDEIKLFGQLYAADASPLGGEFPISPFSDPSNRGQGFVNVTMDAAGNFLVTWTEGYPTEDKAGFFARAYGRRFNITGEAQGAAFPLDAGQPGAQALTWGTSDAQGNFVVTWMNGDLTTFDTDVYARRYNAAGQPLGNSLRVNQNLPYTQLFPAIDASPDGSFVVAWLQGLFVGGIPEIIAQRFDAAGAPLGDNIVVAEVNGSSQPDIQVGTDAAGNFTVVWASNSPGVQQSAQYARRYSQSGVPLGAAFTVNQDLTTSAAKTVVAMDSQGNLVAVWDRFDPADANGSEIYAQLVDSTGQFFGVQDTHVNTYVVDLQTSPAVAMNDAGSVVVAWSSQNQDGSGWGVYAQRFTRVNHAPASAAGGPYSVTEGGGLQLDASTSSDRDGDPLSYSWDINGDGVFGDAQGVAPALGWSQLNALGIINGPATRNVQVRVTDSHGVGRLSTVATLSIVNAPPTARAGGPYAVAEGGLLALDGRQSSDPAGAGDPLSFSWDVNGDGVFGDATGATPLLTWAQLAALGINDGPRAITNLRVRVSDDSSTRTSPAATLNVVNIAPTAAAGGPYAIFAGQGVTLTATASDPAGAADPLAYSWDVNGDGVFGDATGSNPTLTWSQLNALGIATAPTTRNVRVRVDDGDGGVTQSASTLLTVNPPATLIGDANGDGTVGAADYTIWAAQFGQTGAGLSADFDGNGQVGAGDYVLWAANFGKTAGGAAPQAASASVAFVPAPARIQPGGLTAILAARHGAGDGRVDMYRVRLPGTIAPASETLAQRATDVFFARLGRRR